jgi:hypothetical protein
MASAGQSAYTLLNGLRYFGVGSKITRNIYKFPDTYYVVTRVNLSTDQSHGVVYGRKVWRGRAMEKDERIHTALKKQWSIVSLPDYNTFKAKPEHVAALYPTPLGERTC